MSTVTQIRSNSVLLEEGFWRLVSERVNAEASERVRYLLARWPDEVTEEEVATLAGIIDRALLKKLRREYSRRKYATDNDVSTLSLKGPLIRRLEAIADDAGLESASEAVEFVVREYERLARRFD